MVIMKRSEAVVPLAVFDDSGMVKFCNLPFAHLVGYRSRNVIMGMNISKFMEQPYGFLHQRWLKVRHSVVLLEFNRICSRLTASKVVAVLIMFLMIACVA